MNRIVQLAYAVAGALVAAPAVISLIQPLALHWAGIALADGFQSFLDAYRGALGPAFGWFDSGVGALIGMLGPGIGMGRASFPGWLEDLHVLSLAAAVIYLGSRMLGGRADEAQAEHPAVAVEDQLERQQLAKEKARESDAPAPFFPLAGGVVGALAILAAGLLGVGVVWLPEILIAMAGHRASWRDEFKAHFAWATAALVVAFYGAAWVAGLGAPHAG